MYAYLFIKIYKPTPFCAQCSLAKGPKTWALAAQQTIYAESANKGAKVAPSQGGAGSGFVSFRSPACSPCLRHCAYARLAMDVGLDVGVRVFRAKVLPLSVLI